LIINKRQRYTFIAMLLLPSLAIVCALILYPLLNGVLLSFTNASPLRRNVRGVGLENYTDLLSDRLFWEVLGNSLYMIGVSIVLAMLIGFAIALLLNTRLRGRWVFRTAVFQVWIVPWITVTILWGWMFNTDYGIVNQILRSLGFIDQSLQWLAQPQLAQIVVILAFTWRTIPFTMVVSLAALQNIPGELLEAASIDGAGYFRRLRFVIIPLLRNVLLISALLQAVRLFQEVTLPWILTQGGPINATTTLSLHTYRTAFQRWEFGTSSAVGVLWLIFMCVFAVIYLRVLVRPQQD
jgi:multiple sugar transport system permease protein